MTPDQHAGRIRAGVARGDDRGAIVDLMDLAREFGSKDDVRDALMLLHESARLARDKRTRVQSQSELDQQVRAMLGSALGLTDALEARANSLDRSVPAPPARDGIEGAQPPEFQSIFGVNNLRHIAWLAKGVTVSQAVCRILTPQGSGTGFMIGPRHVMTNNHVISSAADAKNVTIEFNYETYESQSVRYHLDPDSFFKSSPRQDFDYTVVAVKPPERHDVPLAKWGHVLLNSSADPVEDEHVVIIQHPNGQPKQIALTANSVLSVQRPVLLYSTDTMKGSSGSPVFNDLWQVVAIHHREGPQVKATDGSMRHSNEGVLMSAIVPHLGDGWES